jgi:hypothetical protein
MLVRHEMAIFLPSARFPALILRSAQSVRLEGRGLTRNHEAGLVRC